MENIQPQTERTAEDIKTGLKAIQQRFDTVQSEAGNTMKELSSDFKTVRDDARQTLDASKPNLEEMRRRIRAVYDKLGGLSASIAEMRETAGQAMSQSEPDLGRAKEALKNGLVYLEQTGRAAMENKDRMLSEKDKGEHEYATALCIYRGLCLSARRIREAAAEIEDASPSITGDKTSGSVLARAKTVTSQLLELYRKLAAVRDTVEAKMLPEFERKKAEGGADKPPPQK